MPQQTLTTKTYTAEKLADLLTATLIGDPQTTVKSVNDLSRATKEEISFYSNERYHSQLEESTAGIVLIDKTTEPVHGHTYLVVENPSLSFQRVLEIFFEDRNIRSGFKGIHSSAVIHVTAVIGEGVEIGPNVVIDQGVVIGDYTRIDANCVIYPQAKVGRYCHFYANVTVREEVEIKNRVILQPNCVIGGCGFGYQNDPMRGVVKLEHFGNVILEDDVEVGSGTTIDRGRFQPTQIGRMTKIDNLVQIGHNVEVGMANFIVAQVGIAGSTKVGDRVQIGGQAGLNGHIKIASNVQIAGKSGVIKSIDEPGVYAGIPAGPALEQGRLLARLKTLDQLFKRVDTLENRSLENRS